MSISEWSEIVTIGDLRDGPTLSDDLTELIDRIKSSGQTSPGMVLNFAHVSYLDSSNLAQLLDLRKNLLDRGAGLRLCELSEALCDLLHITGLERLFTIDDTTTTSLAMINMTTQSEDHEDTDSDNAPEEENN